MKRPALAAKWRANLFVSKWLGYCYASRLPLPAEHRIGGRCRCARATAKRLISGPWSSQLGLNTLCSVNWPSQYSKFHCCPVRRDANPFRLREGASLRVPGEKPSSTRISARCLEPALEVISARQWNPALGAGDQGEHLQRARLIETAEQTRQRLGQSTKNAAPNSLVAIRQIASGLNPRAMTL